MKNFLPLILSKDLVKSKPRAVEQIQKDARRHQRPCCVDPEPHSADLREGQQGEARLLAAPEGRCTETMVNTYVKHLDDIERQALIVGLCHSTSLSQPEREARMHLSSIPSYRPRVAVH